MMKSEVKGPEPRTRIEGGRVPEDAQGTSLQRRPSPGGRSVEPAPLLRLPGEELKHS